VADIESIKARIRALRARTVQNGCTEAEALTAAEKVMQLLARHDLAAEQVDIAEEDVLLSTSGPSTLEPLFIMVAWVCHCEMLVVTGGERRRIRYIGRDPLPEAATYLHAVVVGAARRAHREFTDTPAYRRWSRPSRLVADHHFLTGFQRALSAKLVALKHARREGEEQRQDLAAARQAVDQMELLEVRTRGVRQGTCFAEAMMLGRKAGEAAHVGWGLGQSGPAGLLKTVSHG
jgi:hypothetical protein